MSIKKHKPTFEESLQRLQNIVSSLEEENLPLEKSIQLYKEGVTLSKTCREQLENAKHEIQLLNADGSFEPFELTETDNIEDFE